MSVYANDVVVAPTPTPVPSSFLGCYADSKSARIMAKQASQSDMTAEVNKSRRIQSAPLPPPDEKHRVDGEALVVIPLVTLPISCRETESRVRMPFLKRSWDAILS